MILQGNEDLRVRKTIRGIKAAFEFLICEKDYGKITVKELCDRAQINKKTFYTYYETLDALLEKLFAEKDPDWASKPDIKWNFTKFVIDREGHVVARFEPTANMADVENCIKALL